MKTETRSGKRRAPTRYDRMLTTFVPKGRSAFCIYAVSVIDHPGVVKMGRTTRWQGRRKSYANWNLRDGDGISQECVYVITEEFIDLVALESAILDIMDWPRRSGREWMVADFDAVCRQIEEFLCEHGISYDQL